MLVESAADSLAMVSPGSGLWTCRSCARRRLEAARFSVAVVRQQRVAFRSLAMGLSVLAVRA